MTPSPPDPSLPARLREFHRQLPLAGDPPNARRVAGVPDRVLLLTAARGDGPVGLPAALYFQGSSFHKATGVMSDGPDRLAVPGFPASFHQEERMMVDEGVATARQRVTLEELRDALRALLPSLEREYGVTSIELFGSYVRGEQDEESDLDVLVEFDPDRGLSLFDFVGLQQELSDRLGVRVDLVEKRSIRPRLRDRILHEAVPL